MKNVDFQQLDYDEEKAILESFFTSYLQDDTSLYMQQLRRVANRESALITVFIEDLQEFLTTAGNAKLMTHILQNTKRYQKLFYEITDALMPAASVVLAPTSQDTLLAHRLQAGDPSTIPSELRRRHDLVFVFREKKSYFALRSLGAHLVGSLVNIRGMVTRVSSVKPHMAVATYLCVSCGHEEFKIVGGMTFLPLIQCNSEKCKTNNSQGSLHHQTRASKFISFQELRIQEPAEEVPIGQVPRAMKVYTYGEITNQCTPGQLVSITGVFLTMPYTGIQGLFAGLLHDTYLEAFQVTPLKKSYKDLTLQPDVQLTGNMYERLARSIAPEIHGLEDVKKALLLLLVGGVTKEMADGMKIRGDLNILLMGDPGVAKSQLLKHISLLTPRGIYTTGKGSSGVGLTAAVLKDPITGEMVLEGGALVLGDQGICCIDEFDKMDERDRTAIHEVMEQQTVSIAKAGITTTLNARTSVLAAANPLYGRYNKHKTPRENINLPAALLSRFDLVFLLLDSADEESDLALAEAVTYVHQNLQAKGEATFAMTSEMLREYISEAKRIDPIIPPDLHAEIINVYLEKRREQRDITKDGYVYVTPRTLLGIIRLAQALSKLRFASQVEASDIGEALRLMEASRATVNFDSAEPRRTDPTSLLFQMVKRECRKGENLTCDYAQLERRTVALGFTLEQLQSCLKTYEELNVLLLTESGRRIMLIE